MKILVTGAAGFIGSHLCERLVKIGHEVMGIDCFTNYYSKNLKNLNAEEVREKGVKIFEIDLACDNIKNYMNGVEVIYHLAAQPGINSNIHLETYIHNNIIATHNLLEASLHLNLKCFINISTSSVYGYYATDSEESSPKPTSYYGITKLAAEQLVMSYYRQNKLNACSLRLFSVYGPRERPEKLYPKLIKSILNDEEFPLFKGSREHIRSFTYISDIIDGFAAVLNNINKCVGEIINIGYDKENKTQDGIELIEKIIGKKAKFKTLPPRDGDQLKTCANIEKARRILNYNPTTPIKEGLEKTVKWYKDKIHNKIEL